MTTKLQQNMIVAIAEDEITPVNGQVPQDVDDATTWTDCIVQTPESKVVATSLINAGLIYITGSGKDSAIGLTDKGFFEYQRINKESIS